MQTQLNDLTNSDQYIQHNLLQWEHLASLPSRLSEDEKKQAKAAARVLRKAAAALYPWGSTYDAEKSKMANGYNALAGILENRSNGLKAYGVKGLLGLLPGLQSGYETAQNSQLIHDVNNYYISDPNISTIKNNNNALADMQTNNPLASTLGTVSGIALQTWLGGKMLGALGPVDDLGGSVLQLANDASHGKTTAAQYIKQWLKGAGDDVSDELVNKATQGYNENWEKVYIENVEDVGKNAKANNSEELDKAINASWYEDDTSSYLTTEGAGDLIDGIKITDSRVGGKIPVDEFKTARQSSIKNPNADSMTLGKYTKDADSYIARAGKHSSYFDMGSEYGKIQKQHDLSDKEMFNYFNRPALDDSIASKKTIRFSHNPLDYESGAIVSEWEYIKAKLGVTNANLVYKGGFWYVQ